LKLNLVRHRHSVFAIAITSILVALSGCNREKGEAAQIAEMRAAVDGVRRCADLLLGFLPLEASTDMYSGPRVDALVAAGLVRSVPVDTGGDRPRTRIEVTPAGMAHVLINRAPETSLQHIQLCYGRSQIVSVRRELKDVGAESGPAKNEHVLSYDYKIVQAPEWTKRADIRAAFPFMAQDLEQVHSDRYVLPSQFNYTTPENGGEFSADLEGAQGKL
jgi:hypothetical protein